jgi:hypothetical protein
LNDSPRIVPAKSGFTVDYNGKCLYSRVAPDAQPEKAALAAPIAPRTLYLVPSPLLFYGLQILLGRITEDSAVVCVEADAGLDALSREWTRRRPEAGTSIPLYGAPVSAAEILGAFPARSFRRVVTLRFGAGWRLNEAYYVGLETALATAISAQWSNALTLTRLGRLYARNALKNLPLLAASPRLDALAFAPIPTLLAGAGPSLDHALDRLSPWAGKRTRPFAIIAVDTALPALRARGLTPDLVVALEAQHWNLPDFFPLPNEKDTFVIALDMSALPASARVSRRPVFFATVWSELRLFDDLREAGLLPPELPPMGSVGLAGAALAKTLAQGPVVSAGLDFAFTLDQSHCRGSEPLLRRLREGSRFASSTLPAGAFRLNNSGLYTTPVMANYRALFDSLFAGSFQADFAGLAALPCLPPEERRRVFQVDEETLAARRQSLVAFTAAYRSRLLELRSYLSGAASAPTGRLEELLVSLDFLWAHFPDYPGGAKENAAKIAKKPLSADQSFLKRVRVEIDPFLAILSPC